MTTTMTKIKTIIQTNTTTTIFVNSHCARPCGTWAKKECFLKKYDISHKISNQAARFWQNFESDPKLLSCLFILCVFIKYSNFQRNQCTLNWNLGWRAHVNDTKNGQNGQKRQVRIVSTSKRWLAHFT